MRPGDEGAVSPPDPVWLEVLNRRKQCRRSTGTRHVGQRLEVAVPATRSVAAGRPSSCDPARASARLDLELRIRCRSKFACRLGGGLDSLEGGWGRPALSPTG